MDISIKHFMGACQPLFRIDLECHAKRVFQALDGSFSPEVFLVGILAEPEPDRFKTCVEPDDDFWIDSAAFSDVLERSNSLWREYPESAIRHSDPADHESHVQNLLRRAIRETIRETVDACPTKPDGISYAVSHPARVTKYWVSVVVGLQDSLTRKYYSLKKSTHEIHDLGSTLVSTSLIDAATHVLFNQAHDELLKPDPGSNLSSVDVEQVLRSAGQRLVRDVVLRVGRWGDHHGFFRACSTISSLMYEKSVAQGNLLLAKQGHEAIVTRIRFSRPSKMREFRASRKSLEMTSQRLHLHSDSRNIFGLVEWDGSLSEREDLFNVGFREQHHWELIHAGHVLMEMRFGVPSLPQPSFDKDKLRRDLPRLFRSVTNPDIDLIVNLVEAASTSAHGTTLIITEAAEEESKRLGVEGTEIEPVRLDENTLTSVISIDGAVILSPQGVCRSIGTILDGLATSKGNPGRGSRFNSAVRYVEASRSPCLAVVLSEDGGIDFIPDLRPAIPRSRVDEALSTMEAIASSHPISRRDYLSLVDWLDIHRFYLRLLDCEILNTAVGKIQKRLAENDDFSSFYEPRQFVVDPEMDETMYYM